MAEQVPDRIREGARVAGSPVYSAHSGDPCYDSAGFASSVCTIDLPNRVDSATDGAANSPNRGAIVERKAPKL
jgi:hypothetical protein